MAPIVPLITGVGAKLGALVTGGLAAGGPTVLPGLASAGASSGGGILSTVMNIAGTALPAVGSIYSGIQQKAAANFTAKQLKKKGDAEHASAQRESMQRRREKDKLMSRVRAVAGASGGAVQDDTVTEIMANVEQQGEYNALADMYKGKESRATLYGQAASAKAEGKSAMTAGLIDAAGTIYSATQRKKRFYDYAEDYA